MNDKDLDNKYPEQIKLGCQGATILKHNKGTLDPNIALAHTDAAKIIEQIDIALDDAADSSHDWVMVSVRKAGLDTLREVGAWAK